MTTLTRSSVHTQFVSVRTHASIRARCIVTNAHAQIIFFVHLALVNVFARSIILRQPVARLACASIRSPEIDATLCAQALYFFALINVDADFVVFVAFLEPVQTVTAIRTDGVQAFSVYRTNLRMERNKTRKSNWRRERMKSAENGQFRTKKCCKYNNNMCSEIHLLDLCRIRTRSRPRNAVDYLKCDPVDTNKCNRPAYFDKSDRDHNLLLSFRIHQCLYVVTRPNPSKSHFFIVNKLVTNHGSIPLPTYQCTVFLRRSTYTHPSMSIGSDTCTIRLCSDIVDCDDTDCLWHIRQYLRVRNYNRNETTKT